MPRAEAPPPGAPAAPARLQLDDPVEDPVVLGEDYRLDPRSISADRLRRFVAAAVLSALSLGALIPAVLAWPAARLILVLLWVALVVVLLVRAWWWPAVHYRHISYRIDARSLVIRRGVWWRSVALVPRSRVQHTDVSQNPVERYLGLGTLIVHTAGTQYAAVPLAGLAHPRAMQVRDLLIDESGGDAV